MASPMKTNPFDDVYAVVRLIPAGRVTSYGAIANYLGTKGGARLVGWAMNACHSMPDVPAQRVVNRNGVLTGKFFFGSNNEMQTLLEAEGIEVQNNQVQNFDKVFWNPAVELV